MSFCWTFTQRLALLETPSGLTEGFFEFNSSLLSVSRQSISSLPIKSDRWDYSTSVHSMCKRALEKNHNPVWCVLSDGGLDFATPVSGICSSFSEQKLFVDWVFNGLPKLHRSSWCTFSDFDTESHRHKERFLISIRTNWLFFSLHLLLPVIIWKWDARGLSEALINNPLI